MICHHVVIDTVKLYQIDNYGEVVKLLQTSELVDLSKVIASWIEG